MVLVGVLKQSNSDKDTKTYEFWEARRRLGTDMQDVYRIINDMENDDGKDD